MYKILRSNKFKKDYKKSIKRNKNPQKLQKLLENLVLGAKLEAKYKDHQLSGIFSNYRECHIEPDWLLIYRIEGNILILERLGTHSDLF
jgi:mRNA interferase YafQ